MDAFEKQLAGNVEYHGEQLVSEARALGQRLLRLAETVARDGETAIVNGLGEIQSQGTLFDARCAQWSTEKQMLVDYRALRSANLT